MFGEREKASSRNFIRKEIKNFLEIHQYVLEINKNQDFLKDMTAFHRCTKNGLDLDILSFAEPPEQYSEWMFDLYVRNMTDVWNDSYAWNITEKQHELLEDQDSHYLVAVSDEDPVAFVQFKFEQCGSDIVLFISTIQVEPHIQRHGLGKFLINALYFVALDFDSTLITMVYKANVVGMEFFTKAKFIEHPSSPGCLAPEKQDQHKHVILHKPNRR